MGPPDPGLEKAKPLTSESLAAEDAGVSGHPTQLSERLRRYGTAKARNHEMAGFLVQQGRRGLADKLYACGSYLRFRHYLGPQQTRLIESRSCDKSLLCPLCAIRRGARMLRRYAERCEYLAPAHDFYLVTLTVKNGPDLEERVQHLLHSWKRVNERAKKGYGAFADASGAFCSIEVTKSGHGWHPHMHMIWAMPKGAPELRWGKDSQLAMDWLAATGDSYIVHAERVSAVEREGAPLAGMGPANDAPAKDPLIAALCECLKYAVKFSDLDLDDNLQAFDVLKGKRLTRSYGCFFGLEVPDEDLDDDELDGPYLEWLFKYSGSRGYILSSDRAGHTLSPERNLHGGLSQHQQDQAVIGREDHAPPRYGGKTPSPG